MESFDPSLRWDFGLTPNFNNLLTRWDFKERMMQLQGKKLLSPHFPLFAVHDALGTKLNTNTFGPSLQE